MGLQALGEVTFLELISLQNDFWAVGPCIFCKHLYNVLFEHMIPVEHCWLEHTCINNVAHSHTLVLQVWVFLCIQIKSCDSLDRCLSFKIFQSKERLLVDGKFNSAKDIVNEQILQCKLKWWKILVWVFFPCSFFVTYQYCCSHTGYFSFHTAMIRLLSWQHKSLGHYSV